MWLLIGRLLTMIGAGTIGGWLADHFGSHQSEGPNLAGLTSDDGGMLGTVPLAPSGPSQLQQGVNDAGSAYQQDIDAAATTREKVAEQLKQIFASNDGLRTQVQAILNDLTSKHKALVSDPAQANNPTAWKTYLQSADQKLGQLQQLLNDHKVDATKQAEVLSELADEYKQVGGNQSGGGGQGSGAGGSGNNPGGSGAGGAGAGASPAGDPSGGGQAGLVDPLAGMGMPGAGMAGRLPGFLSGPGSAPAGLSGLGGAPLDALSALPALASMGGHSPDDSSVNGHGDHDKTAEPADDDHGKKGAEEPEKPGEKAGQQGEPGEQPGAGSAATAQQQGTPVAAAPAGASTTDAGRVVQMPDGTPVTAPSTQKAGAIRSILSGSGVTDAYKGAGMALSPPGTPVTQPVDPGSLTPGMLAAYKSREPIPYMGADKIWLDGQLQPKSALPAGDFLAWFDPQAAGANVPAAAPAAVPSAPTTGS